MTCERPMQITLCEQNLATYDMETISDPKLLGNRFQGSFRLI